jgi:hypothetical protein
MIAAGLSAILFGALLSSVIFFSRGGIAMNNYYEMESQSRFLLERFARDVREASDALWQNTNTVKLTVDGNSVTYSYDPQNKEFVRLTPGPQGPVTDILADSVESLKFLAYDKDGALLDLAGLPSAATKMIQVSLSFERSSPTGPTNSQETLSSRLVLRNKPIPAP